MWKKLAVLSLVLSLAGSVWAQQLTDAAPMTGRVSSVDAHAKTFNLETPSGTVVFKTDARTTFMNGDMPSSLVTLKVGDRIRVTYSGEAPDRTAARVETIDVRTTYRSPADMTGMMGDTAMMTGRVTSVDVAGRMLTVDTVTGAQTCQLGSRRAHHRARRFDRFQRDQGRRRGPDRAGPRFANGQSDRLGFRTDEKRGNPHRQSTPATQDRR